ncbi:MAG: hypothetical protein KBA51_04975 [Kiritimatiellae bacterium]|nr:hypothetical protein [Kiritimatiellia bacterium]
MNSVRTMIVIATLSGHLAASAQVFVDLKIPSTLLLEMEPAVVTVTLRNQTGDSFALGGTNQTNQLHLDIQRGSGSFVPPTGEPIVPDEVLVPARGTRTFELNMPQLYQVRHSGPYAIAARLALGEDRYVSERFLFDVVPGFEIARMEARTRGTEPRRMVFMLKVLARDREEQLFIRFDEPQSGLCHGVYSLGSVIRMFEPRMMVDHDNRVHVLHQSAPQRFTHSVFELDGAPVSVKYYGGRVSDARMEMDEDGVVEILGVVPYQGDPSIAPLRSAARVWAPAPPPPPPPRRRPPSSDTPRAPPRADPVAAPEPSGN